MIKCISFDFDRTLAYVNPPTHLLIPDLLKQKGITVTVDEFIEKTIFLRRNLPEHLEGKFNNFGTLTQKERSQFIKDYYKARIDLFDFSEISNNIDSVKEWLINEVITRQKKVLYDDCKDFIPQISERNLKLFVLSGNHSDGITSLLQNSDLLDFFDEIITVDKYDVDKSNNFHHLIELSQVSPEEILHIGDDCITDGFAPRSLGIQVLLIERSNQYTINSDKEHDFTIITELIDIMDFL